jgi:hypothetical protein
MTYPHGDPTLDAFVARIKREHEEHAKRVQRIERAHRWKLVLLFLVAALALFASVASAGVRITIKTEPPIERELAPGWNHLGGSMRASLYDGCVVIGNDVGDQGPFGIVEFDSISIDFGHGQLSIVPRKWWTVDGSVLTIASGQRECIVPRGSLRVRYARSADWRDIFAAFAPPSAWSVAVGRVIVPLPDDPYLRAEALDVEQKLLNALASGDKQSYAVDGALPDLLEPGVGIWRPAGKALPDQTYGGGWGLEPISGWERSALLAVLRHDLAMERHAVGWYSSTGEILPTLPTDSGYYALARGWAASTVPSACSEPVSPGNPYDARRQPNGWAATTCSYAARLTGMSFYDGFPSHDGQHLVRATRHAKSAANLWGDDVARDDLAMIAADAGYAWPALPIVSAGQGCSMGREAAWVVDSLAAGGQARRARKIADQGVKAQMPTGQIMRASYGTGWAFIPGPWHASAAVPIPIPQHHDCAATMESFFWAHALVQAGHVPAAIKLAAPYIGADGIASQLRYLPKFVAVADKAGSTHRTVTSWAGNNGYDKWLLVGLMCHADPENAETYLESALDLPTPSSGYANTLDELKHKLVRDGIGRAQTVAAISALQKHSND